jgi:hypothetical protein
VTRAACICAFTVCHFNLQGVRKTCARREEEQEGILHVLRREENNVYGGTISIVAEVATSGVVIRGVSRLM